jgi:hypothetical protein
MFHESLDSAQHLYAIGALILIVGVIAGGAGVLIKRRLEEADQDERYVREKRGEKVAGVEIPRKAALLQYAGVGLAALGIVILIIGWTVAPGKP